MKIRFDLVSEAKIKLSKNDLEEIEKNIIDEEKFILRLRKEFLKIPIDLWGWFSAELYVWSKFIDGKPCSVKVAILTPSVAGIYITRFIDDENSSDLPIGNVEF